MKRSTSGFTIIELLIVIVVIAILATISVVAYRGVQERAVASTVKSDLTNFAKKIEIAKIDSDTGLYPVTLTQAMGITATKDVYISGRWNWYYCTSPDHTNYALGVVDTSNKGYYQSSLHGLQETTAANVNGGTVCTMIGSEAYAPGSMGGYVWSTTTSTGTWQPWVN